MSISKSRRMCDGSSVNTAQQLGRDAPRREGAGLHWQGATAAERRGDLGGTCPTSQTGWTSSTGTLRVLRLALALTVAGLGAPAQTTNPPASTNSPTQSDTNAPPAERAPDRGEGPAPVASTTPQKLDEASFAIISERNIFNASRSGGRVQGPSHRPTRVESFTLVGTMAYEKGAFAFFDGSSSEFTKVVKPDDVIAGHKLADILANGVKLEADGKQIDLPIGSQMRREDAGTWQVAEAPAHRNSGDSASSRGNGADSASKTPSAASALSADQSEILKKLMKRREKEE